MSEIQECSSVGYVSLDNTTKNENDQSKVNTPLEETRNEIVHVIDKDPVKVQEDITKLVNNIR